MVEASQQVTGLKMTASNQGILKLASPGVSGNYTAAQALEKLLATTGISYRFLPSLAMSGSPAGDSIR